MVGIQSEKSYVRQSRVNNSAWLTKPHMNQVTKLLWTSETSIASDGIESLEAYIEGDSMVYPSASSDKVVAYQPGLSGLLKAKSASRKKSAISPIAVRKLQPYKV